MAFILTPRCTDPNWGKQLEHEQCGATIQITRKDLFRAKNDTVQAHCPECKEIVVVDPNWSKFKWGILPDK